MTPPRTCHLLILARRAALALLLCPALLAQDDPPPSEADLALQKLKASLAAEEGLSPETKAAMEAFFDALASDAATRARLDELDIDALERLALAAPSEPGRFEKLKEQLTLYGDLRLREEYSFDLDDQHSRERARYRLRFGANYQIDEDWSAGARLRTGDPDDPNSPHSTLGDVFNSDSFELDRAFLAYRAEGLDGLKLTGGKFGHPFYTNPVYGELVWDQDVSPEGVMANWSNTGDDGGRFDAMLGYYITVESAQSDASLTAAQLAGTTPFGETTSGTLALGYYNYSRLTPDGNLALFNDNPSQTAGGNAVVDTDGDTVPDEFASDFEIWNPIASVTFGSLGPPLVLSAEYIKNTQASGSLDSGYALGTALGQQKKKGDWQGYYQYQVVEQDAVFAPFAQDDFLLAANQRGHVFGVRNRITDTIGAHLWALVSSRDETGTTATTDSDRDQWRMRLDLDVRF